MFKERRGVYIVYIYVVAKACVCRDISARECCTEKKQRNNIYTIQDETIDCAWGGR